MSRADTIKHYKDRIRTWSVVMGVFVPLDIALGTLGIVLIAQKKREWIESHETDESCEDYCYYDFEYDGTAHNIGIAFVSVLTSVVAIALVTVGVIMISKSKDNIRTLSRFNHYSKNNDSPVVLTFDVSPSGPLLSVRF